ncbi:MAG: hypothetical protein KBT04_08085 [Bacteroidales bacterium]|nr:hypothetical protein [Candidatus Colimorpha onthohippi]
MKTRFFLFLVLVVGFSYFANAQIQLKPIFNQLNLEARADFDHFSYSNGDEPEYGFNGRYFNLVLAGDLGGGYSYYFRQRIVADPGATTLFDNTDFLYLNYNHQMEHSSLNVRLGKDAIFAGGFEYDAAPIEVLFNSYSWGAYYCFQLGASLVWSFDDDRQNLALQISNSPYVYSDFTQANFKNEYLSGLFAYSLFWKGQFGHFLTLYSANLFERDRGYFMGNIGLGHKLKYDRWDIYVDFVFHALGYDDWGTNNAVVSCANYKILPWLNVFAKGGYESNHSKYEYSYDEYVASEGKLLMDCLELPETDQLFYGAGVEIIPTFCTDVNLHAYVCNRVIKHPEYLNANNTITESSLNVNVGITWHMDIHKQLLKRYENLR